MTSEAVHAARYSMLKALASEPSFADVAAAVQHTLVERAEISEIQKGGTIYEAGEQWGRLGFVVDGCIAMVTRGDDAKEHLYEHAFPGQFFGVSAMFDGGAEMARTFAVSDARLALVDCDTVLALCKEHGALAIAFARTLARRVRRTTSLLADQLNLSPQERIARYLLSFASGENGMSAARDPLPLLTQAQIGAAAGTVKDVAARTIGDFERRGALRRERGRIRWLDRDQLVVLARVDAKP